MEQLESKEVECFKDQLQEMRAPQQELWEEDGDERTLRYDLSLVHSTPALISFYGSKYT